MFNIQPSPHIVCYETLIRQALDAPIRFLLRHPNRRQNRRSYKHAFPTNMIMCIRHCNPHVTHHMQSSRDSQLSRFTKCLSPSLSHPLSLYVRSFHTLHSRIAQLHSLHSCTVSVVDCALSTVRSNAQSTVVYTDTLQHRLYTYSDRSGEPERRRQSGADTNDRESRRNSTPKPDPSRNTRNAPNEAPP